MPGEDPQLDAEQHESVDQEALNDVSIDSVEADDVDLVTEGEGEGV